MQTVLSRATRADVVADPFPHVVLRDALDDDLFDELQAAFPATEVVAQGTPLGSNTRLDISAAEAAGISEVPQLWREFLAAHSSQTFLDQLVDLFGEHIRREHPSFEERAGDLEGLRAGMRKRDDFDAADVLLDAQISVNSPVTGPPSSVRRVHLDNADKLFAGLFYMRRPEDDSTGGDLELLRYRDRPRGFRGPMLYDRFTKVVTTVPYSRNTLVLFLNTPHALHGVTVRSRTQVPRQFVNLVAQVPEPLFSLDGVQATTRDKVLAGPEIVKRRLAERSAKVAAGAPS